MRPNIAKIVSEVRNLQYAGRAINTGYVETLERFLEARDEVFNQRILSPQFPLMSGFETEKAYVEWYQRIEKQALQEASKKMNPLERKRVYDLSSQVRGYLDDLAIHPMIENPCDNCFTSQDGYAVSIQMMLPTGKIIDIKKNESTNTRYSY